MKGSDYIANERLTDIAGKVLAAPGDSCANVPEKSLPWLLEGGHIKPAEKRARVSRPAAADEGKE